MKKLLYILLLGLFAPFISKAQVPPYMQHNQKIGTTTETIYVVGGLWSDSVFNPPNRDTLDKPLRAGALQYSYAAWWGWDGTKWVHFAQDTLFAAQVNSDWTATSGVAFILHKPTFATVAFTGNYFDLINLPVIPPGQVNTDWNSLAGLSQLLNEPRLVDTIFENAGHDTLTFKIRHVNALTTYTLPIAGSGGGSGTVDSVSSANIGSIINVTVTSPTLNPHFAYTIQNESANTVWAGPVSGGAAPPTFRALVAADLPLVPNSKLVDSFLNFAITNVGTSPHWVATKVPLGGTATLSLPIASALDTGLVTPAQVIYWNSKLDSVFHDGTLTGNGTAAHPLSANILGNDTLYVVNGIVAVDDSTFGLSGLGGPPLIYPTYINGQNLQPLHLDSLQAGFFVTQLAHKAIGATDSALIEDVNGQVFKAPFPGISSSFLVTANNGLSVLSLDTVQLGGNLVKNTTVNGLTTFTMNFTGAQNGNAVTLNVANTGTGGAIAATSVGNVALSGTATNAPGMSGQSTNSFGVLGASTNSAAGVFDINPANSNLGLEALVVGRATTATPANGIGAYIEYDIQDSSGVLHEANQLRSYLVNVNTSIRESRFDIWGVNANSNAPVFGIDGSGQGYFYKYTTSSSFTGTPVALLATDNTGKVIQTSLAGSLIFNNGITNTSGTVQWGGALIQNTTITQGNNNVTFNQSGFGEIAINGGSSGSLDLVNITDTAISGVGSSLNIKQDNFGPGAYIEGIHNAIKLQTDSSNGTGVSITGRGNGIQITNTALDGSFDATVVSQVGGLAGAAFSSVMTDAVTTGELDMFNLNRAALAGHNHKGSSIGARWQVQDDAGSPVSAVQSYVLSDSTHANGTIEWHLNLQRQGALTNDQFIFAADETVVNGSTSGNFIANEPLRGISWKKVILQCNSLNGTATYTFPVSFALTPIATGTAAGVTVSAVSNTAVTLTGTGTSGYVILEGK